MADLRRSHEEQLELLEKAAQLLTGYVASANTDTSKPVVQLASPDELRAAFGEAGVPMQLPAGQAAVETDALLDALRQVLRFSMRTSHPLFYNQLYARVEPAGLAAEWLAAATNTNVHTFEVAPVYTMLEGEVIAKMASIVGYPESTRDGLLVPGGSASNLYAMHIARHRAFPDVRRRGLGAAPPLAAFTSSHSHYSYTKAAALTGLGTDNMVAVETDEFGAMLPEALEAAVERAAAAGQKPFFVGLTAGTTVTGAFDPVDAVADVCARHGLWLHVDGCWGASLLLSRKHRHVLAGLERADSVAWNAHKMMGVPLACSAFLTRHRGLLEAANSSGATYLFQPDKLHTAMDIGDKSLQCGRKSDSLKLWLMWKAVGDAGWEARIDHCVALADHFQSALSDPKWGGAFRLVMPRACTNVCFWWVPPALRPFDPAAATEEQLLAIGRAAPRIKALMQAKGDAMIGFQPLGPRRPNFFRIVFANAWSTTFEMVDALLERINDYGLQAFAADAAAAAAEAAAPAPAGAGVKHAAAAGAVGAGSPAGAAAVLRRVSKSSAEAAGEGVAAV
ncbi:glutamate decarboxylase [Raphidocelis subcapitata]|uniref:Glutamate decarboxylase n=1 Tax=Raphidocelis subcapitata TaxID=307507 RepID=A0A2V0NYT8_9CHLO|nr:glutamate decarboxylase [Raphidocelis subcapitata]|eukprot:GBF91842.1 glutamate decarboxylase [Raphidocelis subcapitata]